MGLYGNEECIYNESTPNPYYICGCKNPEIDKDTVESSFCNVCDKAKLPEFNSNSSLEELIEEIKTFKGVKRKKAKRKLLEIVNEENFWEGL
ncbi:MAG: hypothetical protein ACOC5T_05170 [Elusimicrobiota bacterium]